MQHWMYVLHHQQAINTSASAVAALYWFLRLFNRETKGKREPDKGANLYRGTPGSCGPKGYTYKGETSNV